MPRERTTTMATSLTPFGNPDGSKGDLNDISRGFVNFATTPAWGGLATRDDDLQARVIVGKKGSGKTVYLRRLQAHTTTDPAVYSDAIQQDQPQTAQVIKVCQLFPKATLTESWIQIWDRAILRSLVTHVLRAPQIRDKVEPDDVELLNYPTLLRTTRTPLSVYSQACEIIDSCHTARQFTSYLSQPEWNELEYSLADILKRLPPICFYIDAIDEVFEHAPMFWLRCQEGLFYQCMHLLRDHRMGRRLHVFTSVRDIVYASIMRSEHASRYYGSPYIRVLRWSRDACHRFLIEKVAMLEQGYFAEDCSQSKTLETWLGLPTIHNASRNIDESISQYLLRHTRMLPRDIVELGNELCLEIASWKLRGCREDMNSIVRRVVSQAASRFGTEQLTICGNQIASESMPEKAAIKGYSDVYTGYTAYSDTFGEKLKDLIRQVGKDEFTNQDLKTAIRVGKTVFGENSNVFSVLWQNGLVGYANGHRDNGVYEFFSENGSFNFRLPEDKAQYAFHPCLIDAVGIVSVSSKPVLPF